MSPSKSPFDFDSSGSHEPTLKEKIISNIPAAIGITIFFIAALLVSEGKGVVKLLGLILAVGLFLVPPLLRQLTDRMSEFARDTLDQMHGIQRPPPQPDPYQDALDLMRNATASQPQDAANWHLLGVTLDSGGKHDEALTHYEKALELDPCHADAWYRKGIILFQQGRVEEAHDCFREAARFGNAEAGEILKMF